MAFFIQSLAMQITQDTAVTIKYQVTSPAGKPLDSGHLAYLHGGYDSIFPKVEAALHGQAVGSAVTLNLNAEEAFGERDESLVRVIPKAEFPPGVKVGGQLQGAGDDGQPQRVQRCQNQGPRSAPRRQPRARGSSPAVSLYR